jgi:cystathionine beta-lyase/cystathionine gamma-synthase
VDLLPSDIAICVRDAYERDAYGRDMHETASLDGVPVSAPIVQSALFTYPTYEALVAALGAERLHHVYSRGQNPTVEVLERKLTALEGGETCKAFSSGMGAVSAVMMGLLKAGDHVLFVGNTYGPTLQLAEHLQRFGIRHDLHMELDPASVARAVRADTRLVWLEMPGTMLFRVPDTDAIAAVAHERGALLCVDSSWATPLLHKPLAHGADIVVHSASKYLSGHSDLMAGAVVTRLELLEPVFERGYMLHGASLSAHDAWLVLRGMRTLPVRLAQHEVDALRVAEFLRDHAAVNRVHHPALADDRLHVRRQLRGYSGLFSFELANGDFDTVARVLNALRVFRLGVGWGGAESIAVSPNRGDPSKLAAQQLPPGLIRLSVGLEGAGTLIDDLRVALEEA